MRKTKKLLGIASFALAIVMVLSCPNPAGDGTNDTNGIYGALSAYVSTNMSDEDAYELAFESTSSSAKAAVPAPKEDGNYSLIVYDVKDGKVKGVSEGKIKSRSGGLTLKPNDANDLDIIVTLSGGEMTNITGSTNKGGNHTMPGKVKPFRQTEGVSGDFKYVNNPGGTVTITEYIGNGGAVSIPANIEGKKVIGIGQYAFFHCFGLTSINIPDTITSIGMSAFSDCTSLISITIPDSVDSIGMSAFRACTSLTSITLGSGIKNIGGWSFEYCTKLTNINIPDTVTSIDMQAFNGSGLTSVIIGNGVTFIGQASFGYCPNLTSVTIGSSVTSIWSFAFGSCPNLKTVICNPVTPPVLVNSIFNNPYPQIKVPSGSVEAYKKAVEWAVYASSIVSQ